MGVGAEANACSNTLVSGTVALDGFMEGLIMRLSWRVWTARLAFVAVFVLNIVCALQFVIDPGAYAPGFQLTGIPGSVAVRGMGVAFLMWNATYPFFIVHPERSRILGVIILIQQAIGCIGETCILLGLPAGYETLASSIERFIAFDVGGLAVMAVAFLLLQGGEKSEKGAWQA